MARSQKLRHALDALPSDAPIVRDLLRRYAKAYNEAGRLEREAKKAESVRERLAMLRESRGQMQTALNCLREASEQSHRAARTPARVGHAVPSWLAKREPADENPEH
jgi:hypothetical protein